MTTEGMDPSPLVANLLIEGNAHLPAEDLEQELVLKELIL